MAFEDFEEELEQEAHKRPFNMGYLKRMLKYAGPYGRQLGAVLVLLFVSNMATLAEPYLISVIVDHGIMKADTDLIGFIVGIMLALNLYEMVARMIRIRLLNFTGSSIIYDMRQELFHHIQYLSLRFYDHRPVGKIMSRLTSDVSAIQSLINGGMITIFSQTIMLVGIVITMFALDWKLSLVAFTSMPFLILLVVKVRPAIETSWRNVRRAWSNMNAHLNEALQGLKVTQAFVREGRNMEKFEQRNKTLFDTAMKALKLDILIWPSVDMIGVLGGCVVILFGAGQVSSGALSVGLTIAFVNYVFRFWRPISAISRVYSQLLSAMASAERIFEYLDTEPQVLDVPDAKPLPHIKGDVTFDHVYFQYEPDDKMVLTDIDVEIKTGQTVALVGPTGAGKTTFVNMVMRFYDPIKGRVLIDGHDLSQVQLESIRNQIAIVLQDSFSFSGTIRDNIRYGKPRTTEEEIIAASKAVRLHEFVQELEEGYSYEVHERGSRLSVGQRQLVAFARALIADPRILILDEATSSVDTETERVIQQAMDRLFEGRTAFVIAHRLSTIQNADLIIVLEDGKIAEKGTHDELLENEDGIYYNLYHTQFRAQREREEEAEKLKAQREATVAEA